MLKAEHSGFALEGLMCIGRHHRCEIVPTGRRVAHWQWSKAECEVLQLALPTLLERWHETLHLPDAKVRVGSIIQAIIRNPSTNSTDQIPACEKGRPASIPSNSTLGRCPNACNL
jgi:hypothetical protein